MVASRVAALFDVHGNLPALEAALAAVDEAGCDLVVFGGDLYGGPLPAETLEAAQALGSRAVFLRGNGERELVEPQAGDAAELWASVASLLDAAALARGASWPLTLTVDVSGLGPVLFCHATPRRDDEIVTAITPEAELAAAFTGSGVGVAVCGHTHVQFDRLAGPVRVVNAGSVGMPYGEPGAHWALLGPGVELVRTPYDLDAAAERLRAGAWEHADEFVREFVLARHSGEEATAEFERRRRG